MPMSPRSSQTSGAPISTAVHRTCKSSSLRIASTSRRYADAVNGDEVRGTPTVQLSLPLEAAEALHAVLEERLESDQRDSSDDEAGLERAYRVFAWRILAHKSGAGLTGRMA